MQKDRVWLYVGIYLLSILALTGILMSSGLVFDDNCDCEDEDVSSSDLQKKTTRTTSDKVNCNAGRHTKKSAKSVNVMQRLEISVVRKSADAPAAADVVWTPPGDASGFSFETMQPVDSSAPPFRFQSIPIRSEAPDTPDLIVTYTMPSASEDAFREDVVVVELPDGPEAFCFPVSGGETKYEGLKAQTEEGSAWDIQRYYYVMGDVELTQVMVSTLIDAVTSGEVFVGLRVPVASDSGFRVPLVMKDGEAPQAVLKDYRNSNFDALSLPISMSPARHEFLENGLPGGENSRWIAFEVPPGTVVQPPEDLPIPGGSWEFFGRVVADLSEMAVPPGGFHLESVACIGNQWFGILGGNTKVLYSGDGYTCLGPFPIILGGEGVEISGMSLVRVDPGDEARIHYYLHSSEEAVVNYEIQSDRERSWNVYGGDWDEPDFNHPYSGEVDVPANLVHIWLVRDTAEDESGFENVRVTITPENDGDWVSAAATSVQIGTYVPPATENEDWISVAVHGPGANQSRWRTDLGILNTGGTDSTVTITVHADTENRTLDVVVPGGGQHILQDLLALFPFEGAGSLELRYTGDDLVTSRTYTEVAEDADCFPGGTLGQFLDSSTRSLALAAEDKALIPQLTENTRYRTNIALTNTGDVEAAAIIHLFNAGGSELGSYDVVLQPGQWEQKGSPFAGFPGGDDLPAGYAVVEVTRGSGVIGYGSVVDNISNDPTTVPLIAFESAEETAWIPVAVHVPGSHGSRWRTDLGLLNPDDEEVTAHLRFYKGDEVLTTDVLVNAHGQAVLADVVDFFGVDGSGALSVEAAGGIVVTSRTYTEVAEDADCFPGGTLGQFLDSSTRVPVLSAGDEALIPQLTENTRYRTNIALTNTGEVEAAATIRLFDGDGAEVGSYEVVLQPGQWIQEGSPFADFPGGDDTDTGYARIEMTRGQGIIGYGSVVDNITNDPTTIQPILR